MKDKTKSLEEKVVNDAIAALMAKPKKTHRLRYFLLGFLPYHYWVWQGKRTAKKVHEMMRSLKDE